MELRTGGTKGENHTVVWVGSALSSGIAGDTLTFMWPYFQLLESTEKITIISFQSNASETGEQSRAHTLGGAAEETEII